MMPKQNGNNFDVSSSGTGNEPLSKITPTRPGTPIPGENSFHLVFEVTDRTKYALDANTSNDTVSVKLLTDATSNSPVSFVPEPFFNSPFKALKISRSDKCIASNRNGTLSLKTFDPLFPHPDTIFVITKA